MQCENYRYVNSRSDSVIPQLPTSDVSELNKHSFFFPQILDSNKVVVRWAASSTAPPIMAVSDTRRRFIHIIWNWTKGHEGEEEKEEKE